MEKKDAKRSRNKKFVRKPATNDRSNDQRQVKKPSDNEVKDFKFKPGNDFSWWNKYPEIMKDAVNMRSNWIPGTDALTARGVGVGVPGAAGFWMVDTYGWDGSTTGPLNISARDLYLKMFQKYRGISSYQAADVGIILVAGIEVIKTVAVLERIYGVINRYNKGNWNMPYTELAALGIPNDGSADKIRTRLSDFRYNLNILINKCQRFCIPKDMSVLANKLSLYGFEFMDHETGKAQIIAFNPTYYGVFDETSLSTGGSVKFDTYDMIGSADSLISLSDNTVRFPLLEAQLDAMLGSDSVQKIFGDFLAWFGEEQMLKLLTLPDDYVVAPVYSKEILHKIHNMDILIPAAVTGALDYTADLKIGSCRRGNLPSADRDTLQSAADNSVFYVYQHNNIIETRFGFFCGHNQVSTVEGFPIGNQEILPYYQISDVRLLDGYESDWSEEFVCEGVLFKAMLKGGKIETGSAGAHPVTAAFELCLMGVFYTRTSDGTITQMFVNNASMSASDRELKLQTLDWAPIIYRCEAPIWESPYTSCVQYKGLYGDIECCRQISSSEIERIHKAAAMSGFKTDVVPKT